MGATGDPDAERHFGGFNTRLVVQYLVGRYPAGTVDAVLRRAGEDRTLDELSDDASWSSYDQFRRLLEATAAEIGMDEIPRIAPGAGFLERAEAVDTLQGLGSPAVLLREAASSGTTMGLSAITESLGGWDSGPDEFTMQLRFVHGFEPFRAWCAYMTGLLALVPTIFGLPPGEAVEEACCCDGAPSCQFTLRWQSLGEAEDTTAGLRARVAVLEGRLDSLESTVADVVTTGDVGATLARIAATAAAMLRAPAHALVLDDVDFAPPVTVVGMARAPAVAVVREATAETDRGVMVAPVSSGRRTFGRLAVMEPGRWFRPHERHSLVSYARLAAAALDSAASVAEARRQARTASALLQLSTALGQVMTTEELAAVLARAVPAVIDCDRAMVVLADAATGMGRITAIHGYPDHLAGLLLGSEVPLPPQDASDVVHLVAASEMTEGEPGADIMRASGSAAAAVVPIVADGSVVGEVVAAVTERPERLARTADLEERLRGIAAQGSAAIRNGLLVDAIRHQALHDGLTGLPNRSLILDRLDQLLKLTRRSRRPVAVLFVDLDGFKDVNDTLGHAAGDRLLCAVAERLDAAVREVDTVGRLGGDEFVVIVGADDGGPTPEAVAERILEHLTSPFTLDDGRALTVTASIGIAVGSGTEPGDLLRDADVALYEAKAAGKSRVVRFRPVMGRHATQRLALEVDLQRAMLDDQFFLVYQPIVELSNERIGGVEALLRWRHPQRGVVLPGDFVPALEETGLVVPVGAWVLRQACAQARRWEEAGHLLTVSVNVSPRQLEGLTLLDDVRGALEEARLPAERLVLEITEGSVMRDPRGAARHLQRIRELGVRVAIDDFGTGYSSLAAVRDFPVDILKIDRSFVAALESSAQSRSLVRLFVQLGRELALGTVAEGVEAAAQLAELRGERCAQAQGFYFSHPVEAFEIDRMLAGSPTAG